MKLFRFMETKYALLSIKQQRIKVSNFGNLNDPFELQAAGSKEKAVRSELRKFADTLTSDIRLICCSREWKSPVLWGHYGDSHRGIALVLEVDNSLVFGVEYKAARNIITKSEIRKMKMGSGPDYESHLREMLVTKSDQWSYETEARILLPKNGKSLVMESEGEFLNCDSAVRISGVILDSPQ